MKPDFQFFEPNFFYRRLNLKNQYFWKKMFICWKIFDHENHKAKIKNLASLLCAEFNADSKSVLFFFVLALIVFDFYSFEISKINNQKNIKILIFFKTYSENQKILGNKKYFFFILHMLC